MLGTATTNELRRHPRTQLRLPVRVRWHCALGLRLEATQTINVSREGLLIHRAEAFDVLSRVWVAFPYDPATGTSVLPETPARVTRVEGTTNGGFHIALRLERPRRTSPCLPGQERRGCSRIPFALPIFVRPLGTLWPEESMTRDISRTGTRFETTHIYGLGDCVLAKIPWGEWAKTGEIPGRVLRIEQVEDQLRPAPRANLVIGVGGVLTSVAVQWTKPSKS